MAVFRAIQHCDIHHACTLGLGPEPKGPAIMVVNKAIQLCSICQACNLGFVFLDGYWTDGSGGGYRTNFEETKETNISCRSRILTQDHSKQDWWFMEQRLHELISTDIVSTILGSRFIASEFIADQSIVLCFLSLLVSAHTDDKGGFRFDGFFLIS